MQRASWLAPILLASVLAGCAATPLPPQGATSPAWNLGDAVRIPTSGHAREPHLAIGASGNGTVIALISYVYEGTTGPAEDYDRNEQVLHRSRDGGKTWNSTVVPRADITRPFDPLGTMRLGDPVLDHAPDGALWLSGTVFDPGVAKREPTTGLIAGTFATQTGIFIARSDDGGDTWGPALFDDIGTPGGATSPDKQWSDVGPDGTVHLTWVRFIAQVGTTHILYTRSLDGGATWQRETVLADSGPQVGLHAPVVAAGGDGRVYLTATEYPVAAGYNLVTGVTPPGGRQLAWTSQDGGATFGGPVAIGEGNMLRFGHVAADAQDPLHAVAVGTEESDEGRVWLAATRDGGMTWGAPQRLSPDREGAQRLPTVALDALGRAHVAYIDAAWPGGERVVRAVLDDGALLYEGAVGPPAPTATTFELGEYFGLATLDTSSYAAWVSAGEDGMRALAVAKLHAGT